MDREKKMKKYLPQLAQGPDIDSLANRLGKNIIDLETAQANLNIFADHIIKLSEEKENLHQDKIAAGMKEYELTDEVYGEQLNEVFPGDEYNPKTGHFISRPENHASLPEELIIQAKITEEMKAIAIERLVQRGEIPSGYIDQFSQK